MKKKFTSLLMALLLCVSVLAGCSLVTRNDQSYYEATVATITYSDGTSESITKRELLMGYNSYGYNYVDNYGYTQEEAIKTTLDTIIEQHLTIKEVKDYYQAAGEELLNDAETTYLWDETYDSVYENLKDYYYDLKGISTSDEEDDDASDNVFTQYERTAELVENSDGSLSIKKLETSTSIRETYTARYNSDGEAYNCEEEYFQEVMYNKLISYTEGSSSSAKAWKSALAEYISDVKDNYSYKTFDSDKDCMLFELNRVYEILLSNYLVEKYTVIYNTAEYGDGSLAGVTITDILSYYSAKVRTSYTDYVINGDTDSFESDILDDVGSVYYVLDGNNANQYFYVSYIKIAFSDEQSEQYTELQEDYAYGNEAYVNSEIEKLYNSLKADICDAETGEETGKTIDATALLQQINSDLAKVQSASEAVEAALASAEKAGITLSDAEIASVANHANYAKAEAFRDYLYLYNDDDTYKNADYNAVFGVTTSGEVLSSDFSEDENVCDAILELYNEGNAQVGDTSDLVRTDDGLYIFFYAGKIENLFDVDENFDISKNEDYIKVLASTRLNIFSEKTIFDSLYETLASSNFTTFQNMDMQRLRSNAECKIIENQIKDLY